MHVSLPLLLLLQAYLGSTLHLGVRDGLDARAVTSTSSAKTSTSSKLSSSSVSTGKQTNKSSTSSTSKSKKSTSTKTKKTSTKKSTSTTTTTKASSTSSKTTSKTISSTSKISSSTKSTSINTTAPKTSSTTSKASTTISKTSSTTSSSSSSPTPTITSGTKRGLSYNDASLTNLFKNTNHLSFQYNWAQTTTGANPAFEFLPMLWNLADSLTSTWDASVHAAITAGTSSILGFNEPDIVSQSNISPAAAAAGWMKYMQPYKGLIQLGGPAISDAGLDWLTQFYGNCTACHIDFQPVHWYDYAWNLGWFNSYVTQAYGIANRTIWVTEFQGWGNDTEQITFLKNVGPWMDETEWIGGYAYFGVFNGTLVNVPSSGDAGATLTDIGLAYERNWS